MSELDVLREVTGQLRPPAYDDLVAVSRTRRRRAAMGAAAGAAVLVVAVGLAGATIGGGLADRTQPAGPPTTDTTSDPADNIPLVAPKSLLDVTELGFHLESVPGVVRNQDWGLASDSQVTTVTWADHELFVRVYYPGREPQWLGNLGDGQFQAVSVNGVTGTYSEQYRGTDIGSPGGLLWESQLIWEYAPGAWATVVHADGAWSRPAIGRGDSPPPQATIRPAFVSIAEAVRSGGGASTRLPLRLGTERGPISPAAMDGHGVSLRPLGTSGADGWVVGFYGEPLLGLYVDGTWCDAEGEEYGDDGYAAVQPFAYRGHTGCLRVREGEVLAVVLRVGAVDRVISNYPQGYRLADHVPDLKQMLAELEVAQLDDLTTWFDLKSALGG